MWFTPLLRSLTSGSGRLPSGPVTKKQRSHGARLQLEMLETRFLPSGFGSVGYVTTNLDGGGGVARAVALQPDGKILAAGYGSNFSQFGLVRYNSDGTLDTSFNGTGIVLTPFVGRANVQHGGGFALALQSDGKIIEAGQSLAKIGDYDAALARFNTNGTLDTTFGTGKKPTGKVTTDFWCNRR